MPDENPKHWWQEDLGCGWVVAVFIVCCTLYNIVQAIVSKR